jgi:hypothetical protein
MKKEKRASRQKPYWNFWKVVFAGWLIQRPGLLGRIIAIPAGIIFFQMIKHLQSK